MIPVKIHNTTFYIKTNWSEYTIADVGRIESIKMPDRFKKLLQGEIQESDITEVEFIKTFPTYFGEVLLECSDIPAEIMAFIPYQDRTQLYSLVKSIIFDITLRTGVSHTYTNPTHIEHNGYMYSLPEQKKVLDMVIPYSDVSTVEFAESSQLLVVCSSLKESLSKNAALLCSLMLRDRSKPYNEIECVDGAAKFADLSMDKFWDVFFSLDIAMKLSAIYTMICLTAQARAEVEALDSQSLSTNLRMHKPVEHTHN